MQASEVVELRVHGVSGTPPEELLDRPLVRPVAGDRTAGFYRPRLAVERADVPPGSTGSGAALEAYSWGGLTSGAPSRALWLLLLPFTLVNVAPRLRPPAAGPTWAVRGLWTTTRVLALSLTSGIVLTAVGVGVDLFGWQCRRGGVAGGCAGPPGWLTGALAGLGPGARLAVGAAVPLLLLAVLAVTSLTTAARYEAVAPHGVDHLGTADPDEVDPDLGHPTLWYGKHLVRRLRHLHLQVGAVTAVGVAVGAVRSPFAPAALVAVGFVVLAAGALVCSFACAGRRSDVAPVHRAPLALWGPTVVTVVLGLVALLTARGAAADGGGLPGYAGTVTVFFAGQTLLVLAIAVCVLALRRAHPARAPFAGFGTVALTSAALLLAGGFSAGVYILAAAWLRTGSLRPSFAAVRQTIAAVEVPQPMLVGAVSFVIVAVWGAVVVAALTGWVAYRLRWPRRWRPGVAVLAEEYPDAHRTPTRDAQILRVWWTARLVDNAGRVVGVFLVPVIAYGVVVAVAGAAQGRFALAADVIAGMVDRTQVVAVGAYLVVGFLLFFVALGALAFRARATRRSVGILWDLASFWPRAVHPLGAPCYAERAIPDLLTRIRWYVGGRDPSDYPTGAVVLAGHSQGSVISAALLAQLATADRLDPGGPPVLPHVAFLTYGSVLRRLYARYFPAYFGHDGLTRLGADLTGEAVECRWRNLWRRSDYLGGPIDLDPWHAMDPGLPAVGRLDRRLVDPGYDPVPGDLTPPPPGRHSNYPRDPAFGAAVAELAGLLPAPAEHRAPGPPPRDVM
ncbi:MAG: sle [Mycobacterium sp.]|nr:sle [Mycobacterium sp.]